MSRSLVPARFDGDGRGYDALGRVVPTRWNMAKALAAFPWLLQYFDRDVPGAAMALDVDDNGDQAVVIACPCGEEPRVTVTTCLECTGPECGRFYFAPTENRVMVGNSPHSPHRHLEPTRAAT